MPLGDPINRCPWCGQTYFVTNGHYCDVMGRISDVLTSRNIFSPYHSMNVTVTPKKRKVVGLHYGVGIVVVHRPSYNHKWLGYK